MPELHLIGAHLHGSCGRFKKGGQKVMHWVHNTCPSLLSLSPRGHSIQEDWSPPKIKRDAFASHMTVWGPLIASHYCKLLGPTSSSRLYSLTSCHASGSPENGKFIKFISRITVVILIQLSINKIMLFISFDNFYFLFLVLIRKLTHTFT